MFCLNVRLTSYKLALALLASAGVIGGACALDVDYRQVVHGLLAAVGINQPRQHRAARPEIMVAAGNELTISGATQTLTPLAPEMVQKRLAWAGPVARNGWLEFRCQSLEAVVAELNRHNQRQLRIGDPQTGRLLVGGKFEVNDLDVFVAALALTHGVRATLAGPDGRFGDVITLSGGRSLGAAAGSGGSACAGAASGSAETMAVPERAPIRP